MGLFRRKRTEEFDDSEWADLDKLLPKDELAEKNISAPKKTAEKISKKPEKKAKEAPEKTDKAPLEKERPSTAPKDKQPVENVSESKKAKTPLETPSIDDEVAELEAEVRREDANEYEAPIVVQRKLIAAFLYGNSVLEKSNVVLRASDEAMVLAGIRDGRITEKDEKSLLYSIVDPIKRFGEDGVDRRLGYAERERRILSYMTGSGFNGWEATDGVTIQAFLKRFPLPADFEAASEGFMRVIRTHGNELGAAEYAKAMENFKKQVYGLRKIYSEQLALLKKKAMEQIKTEAGLIEVSQAEARLILSKTVLSGDALVQGPIERKLTTQALYRNGLIPKWKLDFEGLEIALSSAFKLGTRDIILAYTKVNNRCLVRSYYRNTAQGIWRYLPDYALKTAKNGKDEIWCGPGYAEEMFNLPAELQEKLSEIVAKGLVTTIDDPEFLFVGTAKSYPSVEEYLKLRREGKLEGGVYTEVAARPTIVLVEASRERLEPSKVVVSDPEKRPNFKEKLFEWQTQTTLYGKVKAECFPSQDGKLHYTIMEDHKHHAFVSGVDVVSKVTEFGLRSEWVYAGNLSTPIYVSDKFADGYGDESDSKGNQIGMWKNYVSKIGLIQDYQRSKMDRKKVV